MVPLLLSRPLSPVRVLLVVVGTYSLGLMVMHPTVTRVMTGSLLSQPPGLRGGQEALGLAAPPWQQQQQLLLLDSTGPPGLLAAHGSNGTIRSRQAGQYPSKKRRRDSNDMPPPPPPAAGRMGGQRDDPQQQMEEGGAAQEEGKEGRSSSSSSSRKEGVGRAAATTSQAASKGGADGRQATGAARGWWADEDERREGHRFFGIPLGQQQQCRVLGEGDEVDFTLVTQASPDRLWMLPHICQRWAGPLVVAVFFSPPPAPTSSTTSRKGGEQEEQRTRADVEELLGRAQEACGRRAKLLVVQPGPGSALDWSEPDLFPVNSLRNLAVAEVRTSHFLLADVDLWPAQGLYSSLRRLTRRASSPEGEGGPLRGAFSGPEPRHAFVVPAFSLLAPPGFFAEQGDTTTPTLPAAAAAGANSSSSGGGLGLLSAGGEQQQVLQVEEMLSEFMPTTSLDALRACLHSQRCSGFDELCNPEGHSTTDTRYWLTKQAPQELRRLRCFESNRYEPYLVLRHGCATPAFAEAFTGYGKNKIQHTAHLRALGFAFHVLPPASEDGGLFLVHYPHRPSPAKASWQQGSSSSQGHHRDMDRLYAAFLKWAFRRRRNRATATTTSGSGTSVGEGAAAGGGAGGTIVTPVC